MLLFKRCFETFPWKLIVINVVITTTFSSFIPRRITRALLQSDAKVDCGNPRVAPTIFNRIVGGTEARPHSYPWQCSLLRKESTSFKHFCGASIISSNSVVTAAHCVMNNNPKEMKIMTGGHDRNSTANVSLIEIESIFIHENYTGRPTNWVCDIAMIRLQQPITFDTFAQPICLARDNVADGAPLVTTGWGKTEGGAASTVLRQVIVPVVPWSKCKDVYPSVLSQNMMCAGYEEGGRDSCQGDSGGPLVSCSTTDQRWYLQGITSVGSACASPHKPGIYTSVPAYYNWILAHLSDTDECKSKRTNKCEQLCVNTIGSYTCSCNDGYSLATNGYQCINDVLDAECGLPLLPSFAQRRRQSSSSSFEDAYSAAPPPPPHSYPSLVSISYRWENWKHRCSGCIIAAQWMLTTAACLHNRKKVAMAADEVRLLAGADDLGMLEGTEQEIHGDKIFIHPDFDLEKLSNNIAMVHLTNAFVYDTHIRSVCLPPTDNNYQTTKFDYSSCRSVGWMTTTNFGDMKKNVLRERFVQTSGRNCNLGVGNVTDGICAKLAKPVDVRNKDEDGKEQRGEDSACAAAAYLGGPMLCLAGGKVTVLGLTITDCFKPESYNVFTSVAKHSDWITRTMAKP